MNTRLLRIVASTYVFVKIVLFKFKKTTRICQFDNWWKIKKKSFPFDTFPILGNMNMVVLIETFYVPTDPKQFKIQENLFEFLKKWHIICKTEFEQSNWIWQWTLKASMRRWWLGTILLLKILETRFSNIFVILGFHRLYWQQIFRIKIGAIDNSITWIHISYCSFNTNSSQLGSVFRSWSNKIWSFHFTGIPATSFVRR